MDRIERDKRWENGDGYNCYISSEFASFRKEAWKKQLLQHFDGKKNRKVLDIGTGPGFFACILSEEGQQVTAIDRSEGMLSHARNNAKHLGVNPEFLAMDVNQLEFEEESFDVIVSRNVTWTLEHPEKVYTEWKRLLKPGGKILIYDANWQLQFFDPELRKRVLAREKAYKEKYGREEIVSRGDMEYYATAPLTSIYRPDWDEKTLKNLGMEVHITEDIGRWLYEEWEKELYAESPLFEICAVKKERIPTQENMHTYWQKRAESFGFTEKGYQTIKTQVDFGRYLEGEPRKILDVGCGTGSIGIPLAMLGHRVTEVDLCSNMLEKVKENARAAGVEVECYCTASDELPFEDHSFDAVVCRNLLWALENPEESLRQWKRVLKPDGFLIYQDANHYYYLFDEQNLEYRREMKRLSGTVHGETVGNWNGWKLCDDTALDLPLSRLDRPGKWDLPVLEKLGFEVISVREEYPQKLLKYGIAQGYYTDFMIVALNRPGQASDETVEKMKRQEECCLCREEG